MNMTKTIFLVFCCGAVSLFSACSRAPEPDGIAVEYANVCALENNNKRVTTEGYLVLGSSTFCSGKKGDVSCRLDFMEKPESTKDFTAYVTEGTGANQMEKLPRSYKRDDLKLRANDGSMVSPQDKVRVTGEVISVKTGATGEISCSITVKKIERR